MQLQRTYLSYTMAATQSKLNTIIAYGEGLLSPLQIKLLLTPLNPVIEKPRRHESIGI